MIKVYIDPRGLAELRSVAAEVEAAAREIPKLGAAQILEALRGETSRFARSGRLHRSFRVEQAGPTATVLTRAPYAQIQDQGGTVRPRGRWLRIPIPGRGSPSGLFFAQGRGSASAVLATLSGGRLRPVAALVRSVRIPAKHWLDKAADQAARGVETAAFDRLSEAVR